MLAEVRGNLWDYWNLGHPVAITTNGVVRKDGLAVMGAGIAKQAVERSPGIHRALGDSLKEVGNRVVYFKKYNMIAFPTKNNWKDHSPLPLIEKSARELRELIIREGLGMVYMPRPGCSLGGQSWTTVKPIIEQHLAGLVTIVDPAFP